MQGHRAGSAGHGVYGRGSKGDAALFQPLWLGLNPSLAVRAGAMSTPDPGASPSVPAILDQCAAHGLDVPLFSTTFFIGRENILITKRKSMARWRQKLFAFMSRNAENPTEFFGIPPNQVIELGLQVEL